MADKKVASIGIKAIEAGIAPDYTGLPLSPKGFASIAKGKGGALQSEIFDALTPEAKKHYKQAEKFERLGSKAAKLDRVGRLSKFIPKTKAGLFTAAGAAGLYGISRLFGKNTPEFISNPAPSAATSMAGGGSRLPPSGRPTLERVPKNLPKKPVFPFLNPFSGEDSGEETSIDGEPTMSSLGSDTSNIAGIGGIRSQKRTFTLQKKSDSGDCCENLISRLEQLISLASFIPEIANGISNLNTTETAQFQATKSMNYRDTENSREQTAIIKNYMSGGEGKRNKTSDSKMGLDVLAGSYYLYDKFIKGFFPEESKESKKEYHEFARRKTEERKRRRGVVEETIIEEAKQLEEIQDELGTAATVTSFGSLLLSKFGFLSKFLSRVATPLTIAESTLGGVNKSEQWGTSPSSAAVGSLLGGYEDTAGERLVGGVSKGALAGSALLPLLGTGPVGWGALALSILGGAALSSIGGERISRPIDNLFSKQGTAKNSDILKAIAYAETSGKGGNIDDDRRFIRTEQENKFGPQSSAYGPFQITQDLAKRILDLGGYSDLETDKWVRDKFIPQGKAMLRSKLDDPVYGLGKKGILNTPEDKEMYFKMAKDILNYQLKYEAGGDVRSLAAIWRYGLSDSKGEYSYLEQRDPEYVKRFEEGLEKYYFSNSRPVSPQKIDPYKKEREIQKKLAERQSMAEPNLSIEPAELLSNKKMLSPNRYDYMLTPTPPIIVQDNSNKTYNYGSQSSASQGSAFDTPQHTPIPGYALGSK